MREEHPEQIVIDRSSAERLGDAEIRAWAGDQTVFISSVMRDMEAEREAVAAAAERVGATPVLFERFGGRDDGAQLAYRDGVRGSDIYVGILGERYGVPDESGYSATHVEYNEAVHHGLRISVWATTGDQAGRQRDFLSEIRVFHTTGTYASPEQLGLGVERRLRRLAEQAGSPWCKIGPTLFRASRFANAGERISVEAAIRDDSVLAALESLRPGQWGRPGPVRVTCAGRTHQARVGSVVVEATAGRARRVCIEAAPERDTGPSTLLDASFEGRSPEELTELAVRVALLGQPNPLGSMSFFAEMPNPLAGLHDLELSEDTLPAVAEVLLVEALVGTGRAERITALRLGPQHRGSRRLLLEWLPRQRYSNVAEIRSIEGEVRV